MNRPSLRTGARSLALAVVIIAALASLAAGILSLRKAAELRAQLMEMQALSGRDNARLEAELQGVSNQLADLSRGMRSEIASTRRGAQSDAARLGNRLARTLSSVQSRLDEMARHAPEPRADTAEAAMSQGAATPTQPVAYSDPADDLPTVQKLRDAESFFESGQYARAQKNYSAVLAVHPENVSARLYYAASLYRANPSDSTTYPVIEKHLQTVLQRDGENPVALEILAMIAVERSQWPEALSRMKRLLAVSPGNTGLFKTAGFCALKAGDVGTARELFEKARRESPDDPETLSFLAGLDAREAGQ